MDILLFSIMIFIAIICIIAAIISIFSVVMYLIKGYKSWVVDNDKYLELK